MRKLRVSLLFLIKLLMWPISSLLGYILLKRASENKDIPKWKASFSNKKILIVGTGPSLDKVSDNYFMKFDSILYINHAVKISGKKECEYFFTTDIAVVKKIKSKDYYKNILLMGHENSIIAPIIFRNYLFLKYSFKKDFCWISASNALFKKIKINKIFLGLRVPSIRIFWPEQPDFEKLDNWFNQEHEVNFFPVIESTSALSAILFVAKYSPEKISMIGCDFGMGRAESIVNDCPELNVDVFSDAKEKFYFLKSYLESKSILLENDSWSF